MRRNLLRLAAVMMWLVSWSLSASAQESASELAERAGKELELLVAFQTLERSTNKLDRLLTYGVMSSAGGRKLFEFMDESDYTNPFILGSFSEELQFDAARANATVRRSAIATDDDKENAAAIATGIEALIEAIPEIADAIAASEFARAREIYKDRCQVAFEQGQRVAESAVADVQRRMKDTIHAMRDTR